MFVNEYSVGWFGYEPHELAPVASIFRTLDFKKEDLRWWYSAEGIANIGNPTADDRRLATKYLKNLLMNPKVITIKQISNKVTDEEKRRRKEEQRIRIKALEDQRVLSQEMGQVANMYFAGVC